MVIQINSSGDLLSVLFKNPDTDFGLYLRSMRNGYVVGNAISPNEYHCVFQDTKHSYTRYEDNQIDFKSFCTPVAVLNIFSELFRHLLKDEKEVMDTDVPWLKKSLRHVDTEPCIIEVDNIWCDSNWYRDETFLLSKYMLGIDLKEKRWNLFSLKVSGQTVFDAINKVALVAFFLSITNRDRAYIDDSFVTKYARILGNIKGVPYFVYYLFIKRACIQSQKIFKQMKPYLETTFKKNTGQDIEFTINDTHTDRLQFIRNNIDFSNTILDYGCGEFRATRFMAKKVTGKVYSYDLEDYSELHEKFQKRYAFEWEFVKSLEDVPKTEPLSVVMAEVVEHNELKDIETQIKTLCKKWNVKQLIITTPNRDFNKHYFDSDEFRHDDHKWEMTCDEFTEWIDSFGFKNVTHHSIGDRVEKDFVTCGVVINF